MLQPGRSGIGAACHDLEPIACRRQIRHGRRRAPTSTSVDHVNVVALEYRIGRDERQAFELCGRDQQAIERVPVVRSEFGHAKGVAVVDRQCGNAADRQAVRNVVRRRRRQRQFAEAVFDGDLPRARRRQEEVAADVFDDLTSCCSKPVNMGRGK